MNEFIKDSDNIYINTPYAEVYIPMDFFGDPEKEATIASEYGRGIRTVGLFIMRFFDDDTESRDNVKIRTFNYPNTIDTFPSETEDNVKLTINGMEDKYKVLKYYKGDIFMNALIPRESSNCERFMTMLTRGKIPNTIKYTDVFYVWLKNFLINDVNPGVPSVTMQIIISEMYRNKKNPLQQFRKIAGKGTVGPYDYTAFNMNEVSSHSSILAALTFERFSDKLTTSLNMTRDGVDQIKSPIEKVVSM